MAVKIKIEDSPSVITKEPFSINVTITGAKVATNYLRVQIYKEGTNSYFGETFNGKDWIKNGDGKDYFPIQITTSTTTAKVEARIGEELKENGEFKLKVKRYTASGNAADDETEVRDIEIKLPIVNTPTPVPMIIEPTHEVVQTTIIPTVTFSPTSTPQVKKVLALVTEAPEKTELKNIKTEEQSFLSPILFFVGFVFIGVSVFSIVRKRLMKNI